MDKSEIAVFLARLFVENSYSDWLHIKKEIEERVHKYEEDIIDQDPYLIAAARPTRLGYCKTCSLYVSLISYDGIDFFCHECFMDLHQKPWKEKSERRLEKLREEEKEKFLKTRFERRHAKGLCPLNLRH